MSVMTDKGKELLRRLEASSGWGGPVAGCESRVAKQALTEFDDFEFLVFGVLLIWCCFSCLVFLSAVHVYDHPTFHTWTCQPVSTWWGLLQVPVAERDRLKFPKRSWSSRCPFTR